MNDHSRQKIASQSSLPRIGNATAFNVAAGLSAFLTAGVVAPKIPRLFDGSRRLIGLGGFNSDARHLDSDAKRAQVRATREHLAKIAR